MDVIACVTCENLSKVKMIIFEHFSDVLFEPF